MAVSMAARIGPRECPNGEPPNGQWAASPPRLGFNMNRRQRIAVPRT